MKGFLKTIILISIVLLLVFSPLGQLVIEEIRVPLRKLVVEPIADLSKPTASGYIACEVPPYGAMECRVDLNISSKLGVWVHKIRIDFIGKALISDVERVTDLTVRVNNKDAGADVKYGREEFVIVNALGILPSKTINLEAEFETTPDFKGVERVEVLFYSFPLWYKLTLDGSNNTRIECLGFLP